MPPVWASKFNVFFGIIELKREQFSYHLPAERIAQFPARRRGESRLLHLDAASGKRSEYRFGELTRLLRTGDCLVLNDTRVIPARLLGRKESGGKVEILIERVLDSHRALAQVKTSKAPRPGTMLHFDPGFRARVGPRRDDLFELDFVGVSELGETMAQIGHLPLPPYIRRSPAADDAKRYQTVFGRHDGAVAAPTAALHFDEQMLQRITAMGVECCFITLHVGAATFRPVREEYIEHHRMHTERVVVPQATCDTVNRVRGAGGRIVAVGTTVVRALETAGRDGRLHEFDGETDIFIYPGYRFRLTDCLLTNFHVPESTLLMLVCAFAGRQRVLDCYDYALGHGYRFLSYGDAMFISGKRFYAGKAPPRT